VMTKKVRPGVAADEDDGRESEEADIDVRSVDEDGP